ncbi:hypothetical protein GOP47_0000128 [Adiantum capillus-veneris]|uniref:Uncharacterized protein n=1 Tax=Adiantum capillus-veneris TaxID=13818 RepID=A0A9D4VDC2_ADICA|nr:hypothetical protein GOP47_0000128 [Adiantum capillus-veneris]
MSYISSVWCVAHLKIKKKKEAGAGVSPVGREESREFKSGVLLLSGIQLGLANWGDGTLQAFSNPNSNKKAEQHFSFSFRLLVESTPLPLQIPQNLSFEAMASLLKFSGSKWKKRGRDSNCPAALKTKAAEQRQGPACCRRVGDAKLVQVYAAPTQDEADHPDLLHLHGGVEFDPEEDYAQVLAEARSHLKVTSTCNNNNNNTVSSTCAQPLQHHLDAYKELHSKLGKPNKPSKLWRSVFFWRKFSSSSEKQVEVEFESIFTSPPHPTPKSNLHKGTCNQSRKAKGNSFMPRPATKGSSRHLNYGSRPARKNNSGPLYTDGLPATPFNIKHTKKSYSGPLGTVNRNQVDPHRSPYQLLHRTPLSSPLYSCS